MVPGGGKKLHIVIFGTCYFDSFTGTSLESLPWHFSFFSPALHIAVHLHASRHVFHFVICTLEHVHPTSITILLVIPPGLLSMPVWNRLATEEALDCGTELG